MKEATGELNMTIVTLVAISAIAALLWFVVWPIIQWMIVQNSCQTYGSTWFAVRGDRDDEEVGDTNSDADVVDWWCCPAVDDERPTDFDPDVCFGTDLNGEG